MNENLKVGDLVTLDRSYKPVIPKRVYEVVAVAISKDPFRYDLSLLDGGHTTYITRSTGKGYRLVTEAEKLLFIKDGIWTYK